MTNYFISHSVHGSGILYIMYMYKYSWFSINIIRAEKKFQEYTTLHWKNVHTALYIISFFTLFTGGSPSGDDNIEKGNFDY